MADLTETTPPAGNTPTSHHHHSGIGFTEWMALGLLVFTLLMVLMAVLFNLYLGSPGGLGILHSAAPL